MKKLILASGSPRRKELLKEAGIDFEVIKSDFDENNEQGLGARELVLEHAKGKALKVLNLKTVKEGVILGADTIVFIDDKIIGKPIDINDARRILTVLSGRTHKVITGFFLIDKKTKKEISRIVETEVTFKKLSSKEIEDYLESEEYKDKAGGYAYQGKAKDFISKVTGTETNVIGLPMIEFLEEFRKF